MPFRNFLVETPWPVMLLGITLIALVVSGRRAAITTFLMLALIGVIGEWTLRHGHGLAGARRDRAHGRDRRRARRLRGREQDVLAVLRPVNDVLQTLPQLVYLIPLIYLMPVSVVPGVIAGVLYAFPVVARLVESGVRNVEANTVEAAESFGATRRQILRRSRSRSPRTRSCSASTRGSSWCSPSS